MTIRTLFELEPAHLLAASLVGALLDSRHSIDENCRFKCLFRQLLLGCEKQQQKKMNVETDGNRSETR